MRKISKKILKRRRELLTDGKTNESQKLFIRRQLFSEFDFSDITQTAPNSAQKINLPQTTEFWKRPDWGFVDVDDDPQQIEPEHLKQVDSRGPTNKTLLNFVADAFRDLVQHYNRARTNRRIETEDTILPSLRAKNAWANIDLGYQRLLDAQFSVFMEDYLQGRGRFEKVRTIEDFIEFFVEFMGEAGGSFPVTKIHYVRSSFAPPHGSGMVVDIKDNEHGNHQKAVDIYSDKNYEFYVTSARRYGFAIDKHAPWRMYADIRSPAMKEYKDEYGLESTQNIFSEFFVDLYSKELQNLTDVFVNYWNQFVKAIKEKDKKFMQRCGIESYGVFDPNIQILDHDSYRNFEKKKLLPVICEAALSHGSKGRVRDGATAAQRRRILRESRRLLDTSGEREAVKILDEKSG